VLLAVEINIVTFIDICFIIAITITKPVLRTAITVTILHFTFVTYYFLCKGKIGVTHVINGGITLGGYFHFVI
jgi:hypothetical protein